MTLKELKELADKASRDGLEWYKPHHSEMDLAKEDAAFIIAANPSTILKLIQALEEAREIINYDGGAPYKGFYSRQTWLTENKDLFKE